MGESTDNSTTTPDRPTTIPGRRPVPPLEPEWLIVDGLPLFHRMALRAGPDAPAIVHVHGFGVSGTYLEPTAALLATRYRTFVPDLPGVGRSIRPRHGLDLGGMARALVSYCDTVGVERPILVGNSLGGSIIIEFASQYPDRISHAVLVSPAGGPNNLPLVRAIRQMALDGFRESPPMLRIAVRDYLRFGVIQSLDLFKAMTHYPTLERLHHLDAPTLVVVGERDPLVNLSRAFVLATVPHVRAVKVPGAHALNHSQPEVIADLVAAHVSGEPLIDPYAPRRVAEQVLIPRTEAG
ncbi:alpha/beta fold hydrolase [Microlunatus elymi]|uniref:alpha/beta fold hydrolase n=1 Tax=Microlunatus elymi TaxID=2596828 RepID=UPI00143E0E14|nr:alpha/beta hydrolase [Microlunatus elymi]